MRKILLATLLCVGVLAHQTQAAEAVSPNLPPQNLPAQEIGANDLLAISVYDAPELTRTVRVGADGEIALPMLKGKIHAEGLMPGSLETSVAEALKAEQILVDPVVTITIVEYHSRPISVVGAVRKPLTFQAEGPITLIDAITRAEGLSNEAGPEILISRTRLDKDGLRAMVEHISVKGLIDDANPDLNPRLFGGEQVRVPEAGKVFVVGNVRRPGAFAVQDTSDTTVLKVLALAEGLSPFADKVAFIYRQTAGSGAKTEIPIELTKIMDRKTPDIPLEANDILYIPDNKGRRMTVTALERLAGFGSSTASGLLIWRK